jgi:hypothetical protein
LQIENQKLFLNDIQNKKVISAHMKSPFVFFNTVEARRGLRKTLACLFLASSGTEKAKVGKIPFSWVTEWEIRKLFQLGSFDCIFTCTSFNYITHSWIACSIFFFFQIFSLIFQNFRMFFVIINM